ncbi:hypothetical protein COO60DRAFT_425303 [Scenedesmus sp. NREL 46B-D3]|nr:hypothetical protein COO60DRAFT_425303 [Scenedesmus sp. NREL 46B-D3]
MSTVFYKGCGIRTAFSRSCQTAAAAAVGSSQPMVVEVLCLASDTDDEPGAAQLLTGFTHAINVDSDDEQPLEALKQQLKVKSGSVGELCPTGSQGGGTARQGAVAPKATAAAAAADECDLDNWTLEPLAKRVRRGTGRGGAAESTSAAAADGGGLLVAAQQLDLATAAACCGSLSSSLVTCTSLSANSTARTACNTNPQQ